MSEVCRKTDGFSIARNVGTLPLSNSLSTTIRVSTKLKDETNIREEIQQWNFDGYDDGWEGNSKRRGKVKRNP